MPSDLYWYMMYQNCFIRQRLFPYHLTGILVQGKDFAASADNTNTERVWKEIIRIEKLKKDYKYFFEHTNTGDREALAGLYDSV